MRRSRTRRWASRWWVPTDQFCASTTASPVCLAIPPRSSRRRPSRTLHTRDDLEANLSVLKKTLIGEADSYCIEKRYVRKDGGIVWANLTVGCVRKADGTVDYFVSVIEDITQPQAAEARPWPSAMRSSTLRTRPRAWAVTPTTCDAGTMRLSRASMATYGLSQDTMEITAEQWFARVHRDDVQRLRAEHIRAFKERRRELVNEFRCCPARRRGQVD